MKKATNAFKGNDTVLKLMFNLFGKSISRICFNHQLFVAVDIFKELILKLLVVSVKSNINSVMNYEQSIVL